MNMNKPIDILIVLCAVVALFGAVFELTMGRVLQFIFICVFFGWYRSDILDAFNRLRGAHNGN